MSATSSRSPAPERPSRRALIALTLLVWLGVVLVRWTAPSDWMARDQERVGTYVLDIVQNGSVVVQHDVFGNVASKPPMFNWIAAAATVVAGGFSRFTLAFPSVLASLGSLLLLVGVAARRFGPRAALWCAPLFAFSTLGLRVFFLARSDEVFAFFVLLAALLAWRAWQRGGGWLWFWLAASGATMTKAPHGVLFAAAGLLAVWWERRRGTPLPIRGRFWPGLLVFLGVPLLWVFAAWLEGGQPVLKKLFFDELAGHALGVGEHRAVPGGKFLHPWAWLVTRLAPMSLLALVGLWRVFARPAPGDDERRFERFLGCWLLGGLLMLSLQSTVRFIHLAPLMAPATLLAARELARWLRRASHRRATAAATVAAVVGIALSWIYLNVVDAKDARIVESERMRVAAEDIGARFAIDRLDYFDAPMALQLHLGVFRPVLGAAAAAQLLAGERPVLVAQMQAKGSEPEGAPFVHARYPLTEQSDLLVVGNTATPPAR
ncbi:MAG: glycosyltransferase family 39 protein [Planctomycetes bacterium]|nr:glycosyltransferase family 39 protein [Planctomycetota bacterium]